MLRESSDEEIGAILEKYKISARNFEKDLMMLQIKKLFSLRKIVELHQLVKMV